MNISKLALIALLGSALTAFGCGSDSTSTGGTGGSGASGGSGGAGGTGGAAPACLPDSLCMNGTINDITPCCTLDAPPTQEAACDGTESIENPASCTATGTVVTHRLTVAKVAGDCNAGYNLDSCDGVSCAKGGLAPGEGIDGVDNALAGLAPVLAGVGGNLSGVDQAFSDALCGLTDADDDPETGTNGCETEIAVVDIQFDVDANIEENCANVTVRSGTASADIIVNVSDPTTGGTVCASGTIGTIPVTIAGVEGAFGNAVFRMTVSGDGFSDGLLGATVDSATAGAIADALIDGGSAVVGQVLDIRTDLSGDTAVTCDALSTTLSIGGVALLL